MINTNCAKHHLPIQRIGRPLLLLLLIFAAATLAGCGFSPPFIPTAPTDLQSVNGNGQVSLSWGLSGGATSYNIKRSTVSSGPYDYIATVDPAQVQYTDTTVEDGVTYYYVVSAQGSDNPGGGLLNFAVKRGPSPLVPGNGNSNKITQPQQSSTAAHLSSSSHFSLGNNLGIGPDPTLESGNSNEVMVTATPHIAPAAPSGISAIGEYQRVELSWPFTGTPNNGVTGYNIGRSNVPDGPYSNIATLSAESVTSEAMHYTDTNVTDGTTYYYVVSALSRELESDLSPEASATPEDLPLPSSPVLNALSAQHYVRLDWSGTTTESQTYTVKRSITSGGPYDIVSSGIGSQEYDDTDVADGTVYYYVVSADNPSGSSADSNEVNAIPQDFGIDLTFDNIGLVTGYEQVGTSINDATQVASTQIIIGADMSTGLELYRASLWDPVTLSQQNLGLGGPVSYDNPGDSYVTGISNQGQVFGMRQTEDIDGKTFRPFIWDKDNGMQSLTPPVMSYPDPASLGTLGGSDSTKNSIRAGNGFGQFVGCSPTADEWAHACLWDGAAIDLGTLGGKYSFAEGINDQGDVVGRSETANGKIHAFLWRNGSMIDLNSYLEPYSNWRDLDQAVGINNFGEIVGDGGNTGYDRLFVMHQRKPHPPTACPCEQPTIDRPAPQGVSSQWNDGKDWTMNVEISDNDGLVLRDVKLGHRYMAQEISVPYFTLKTTGFSDAQGNPVRGELKPAGDDPAARSRLIGYEVSRPGSNPLVIKATYAIDRISTTGADSCLSITQRYEFYKEVNDCEPSQYANFPKQYIRPSLKASPFKPIIEYNFHSDDVENTNKDTLECINIPQRLSLRDDNMVANTATFFRDNDSYSQVGLTGSVIANESTPQTETNFLVIQRGQSVDGSFDNCHQTYNAEVEEPTILPPGPGCPECIHFHWRWSALSAKPTDPNYYGGGKARIPNGSNQDVEVAVVKYVPGEEHPKDFHDLLTADALDGQSLVFWYSGTGHQQHDRFFTHGGFFSGGGDMMDSADIQVTQDPVSNTVYAVGDMVDIRYHIKNLGPATATGFPVYDELPQGLNYVDATGDIDHLPFFSYDDADKIIRGVCPTLDVGEEMVIHIKAKATDLGQFTNTLTVEASDSFADPNPDNNHISQTVAIR